MKSRQLLVHAGWGGVLHMGAGGQDSAVIQPTEAAERDEARILSSAAAEISD